METEKTKQMPVYDPDGILAVALDLCEGMLESGAEIHRIEDTAERICKAYGAETVEIYGMTSLILVTMTLPDGTHFTQARRVYYSSNNMQRIEKLNALSRLICRDTPDPLRVKEEIADIRKKQGYSKWLRYIGGFIGALGFALFFGGTVFDALAAGLIGQVVCFLDMNKPKFLNQIAYTVITSASACLFVSLCGIVLGDALSLNTSIISASVIMLMIPGMALGNAIRELLCGEVVSGAVKTMQAVLVAVAIAAGFTGVLFLFGNTTVYDMHAVQPLPMILYAGIGTLGFSILFGVPPKRVFYAILCGMLCHAAYMTAESAFLGIGGHTVVFLSSAVAGAAVTCYAETMARVCKTPTTVFLIAGLIPLVPGCSLYYTMAYLVSRSYDTALSKGIDTINTCLGISVGIVAVSVIFQIIRNTLDAFIARKRRDPAGSPSAKKRV